MDGKERAEGPEFMGKRRADFRSVENGLKRDQASTQICRYLQARWSQ